MNDKYCQLMDGECERKTIRNYCKPFNDQPDEFIANYEQCPWPSRQVSVRPYAEDCAAQEAERLYAESESEMTENRCNGDGCQKDDAYAAGLAEGIRRCREAVENVSGSLPGAPELINKFKTLAAIDAVMEK